MPSRSTLSSTQYIQKVHARIRLLVALGIVGTAILVGLAATYPLYRVSASNFEEVAQLNAESQAEAIRNQLLRFQDVARQFSSRTEIRRALDDYKKGTISLEELQNFTTPRLLDAVTQAVDVVALIRLGPNDEEIAHVGDSVDYEINVASAGDGYPCSFQFTKDQENLLVQACSEIWQEGRLIGRDVVLFSAEPLLKLLHASASNDYQPTIRLIEASGEQELSMRTDGYELQPVEVDRDHQSEIHFDQSLDDQGWLLSVSVPVQQYNQAVFQLLLWPVFAVLLMAVLGTAAVSRTLRPLLIKVSDQATTLERSQQELRQAAGVFHHAQESILITDSDHTIISANPAFSATLGYHKNDVLGRSMQELLDLDTITALDLEAVDTALRQQNSWEGEVRYKTPQQNTLIALQTISAIRNDAGQVVRYIHIFNDITDQKQSEERVRYQALHDELTGIPNRAEFEYRLENAVRQVSSGARESVTILFLDLDKFKEANDTFGHQAGDRVLQLVTERLNDTLRTQDTLARLGGDEFVVLLDSEQSIQDAEAVAHKIIQTVGEPFTVGSWEIHIGVSVGIARYPNDAVNAEALLRAADTAMYAAKDAGRNTWRRYSDRVSHS